MNKKLKWTLIIIGTLIAIMMISFKYMQIQTKKASPEETVEYSKDGKKISVFYCRPSVRNRVIFDSLVPYGQVWRTGANEATTFTTSTDLKIGTKTLPSGTYTLWTIPRKESWDVFFNSKQYGWGVSWGGTAARDPKHDVAAITVPSEQLNEKVEMFTISFEDATGLKMVLAWDRTRVAVPIQ